MDRKVFSKGLFLLAGCLCLALGFAGAFLPLVPTTPFLLLSAVCFSKSSGKLYRWITNHKTFGRPIQRFLKTRALTARTKLFANAVMWSMIAVSVIAVHEPWLRFLALCLGLAGTVAVLSLKTCPKDDP